MQRQPLKRTFIALAWEADAKHIFYYPQDREDKPDLKHQMALLWVPAGLRKAFHHWQYPQHERRAPALASQQEIQSFHHWHGLQFAHR